MSIVIGLLGVKGAGKDTAATTLINSLDFVRIGFADALYREVAETFNVTVEFLGNRDTKETPMAELALRNCSDRAFVQAVVEVLGHNAPGDVSEPELSKTGAQSRSTDWEAFLDAPRSPRVIMQYWGTEYRRRRGVDSYWLDRVAAVMAENPDKNFVITDVRFKNEALFVRRYSGVLMRIRRIVVEEQEARNREASGTAAHASETEMLGYPVDVEAFNEEGDPLALQSAALSFVSQYMTARLQHAA